MKCYEILQGQVRGRNYHEEKSMKEETDRERERERGVDRRAMHEITLVQSFAGVGSNYTQCVPHEKKQEEEEEG